MPTATAAFDAQRMRETMGHFATGVTVITTHAADGAPLGTTVSAVSSLSLDPPLLLACLDRASLTLAALRARGAFAVNVLAHGQDALSARFARRGAAASWDEVAHRPGGRSGPHLHGALAVLDCALEDVHPGGDHEIVVGRIDEVELGDALAAPLLHFRGAYAGLAS